MVKGSNDWELPRNIRSAVLERVRPGPEQMRSLENAVKDLLADIDSELMFRGIKDVKPLLAGSVAKGTVASTPDIDVFLLFPHSSSDSYLRKEGLEIARKVLDCPEKRYTQHPYMTGRYCNYKVDIVPCRKIERGHKVSTAVDRTPYHTEYVTSGMDDRKREETLLLKSFFRGIGAYGAEDTVNGFSGYLCEILILMNGSFSGVINWFSSMRIRDTPPVMMESTGVDPYMVSMIGPFIFDEEPLMCEKPDTIENYQDRFDNHPMVIIDPVDPGRNVAAPVSDQLLAHTVATSREFRKMPSRDVFHPWNRRPVYHKPSGSDEINREKNDTFILDLPEQNPDMIMTQIRSILTKAINEMERRFQWDVKMEHIILFPGDSTIDPGYLKARYIHSSDDIEKPCIIVRIRTDPSIPPLERIHWGPPKDHPKAHDFKNKWGDKVKDDNATNRLFVVIRSDYQEPVDLMQDIWDDLRKGPSFKDLKPRPVENQLIHEVIREASEG